MRDIHLPIFFLLFTLFVVIGAFFSAVYWKPCGVSEHYAQEDSWDKTFLDHPTRSPSELIEETQNELKQLHHMKGATIVNTSRGILDETEKSIQEIQSRLVQEAGQDIRDDARREFQQQAQEQLAVLQEKRKELQKQIKESSSSSPSSSPRKPSKPNVVGMRGGNGTRSGSDIPSGSVYYCARGSTDATFRVVMERDGMRSDPADRTLRIRSGVFAKPRVRVKFDNKKTGKVILQVKDHENNESSFRDIDEKELDEEQEVLFRCPGY